MTNQARFHFAVSYQVEVDPDVRVRGEDGELHPAYRVHYRTADGFGQCAGRYGSAAFAERMARVEAPQLFADDEQATETLKGEPTPTLCRQCGIATSHPSGICYTCQQAGPNPSDEDLAELRQGEPAYGIDDQNAELPPDYDGLHRPQEQNSTPKGAATMTRKEQARAKWMKTFEYCLLAYAPQLAGRIDWDTALHLFFEGYTADGAADRMASRSNPPGWDVIDTSTN